MDARRTWVQAAIEDPQAFLAQPASTRQACYRDLFGYTVTEGFAKVYADPKVTVRSEPVRRKIVPGAARPSHYYWLRSRSTGKPLSSSFRYGFYRRTAEGRIWPAFLAAAEEIYWEALPIILENQIIRFYDMKALYFFLLHIGPANQSRLKMLEIGDIASEYAGQAINLLRLRVRPKYIYLVHCLGCRSRYIPASIFNKWIGIADLDAAPICQPSLSEMTGEYEGGVAFVRSAHVAELFENIDEQLFRIGSAVAPKVQPFGLYVMPYLNPGYLPDV